MKDKNLDSFDGFYHYHRYSPTGILYDFALLLSICKIAWSDCNHYQHAKLTMI